MRLVGHWHPGDPPIMVVLDSGYDVRRLAYVLADLPLHLIGRLRSDRVLLGQAPSPAEDGTGPQPVGRPRRHGAVMTLAKPASWPTATTQSTTDTAATARPKPPAGTGCIPGWPTAAPGPTTPRYDVGKTVKRDPKRHGDQQVRG